MSQELYYLVSCLKDFKLVSQNYFKLVINSSLGSVFNLC